MSVSVFYDKLIFDQNYKLIGNKCMQPSSFSLWCLNSGIGLSSNNLVKDQNKKDPNAEQITVGCPWGK
jgi:hypothetical protein